MNVLKKKNEKVFFLGQVLLRQIVGTSLDFLLELGSENYVAVVQTTFRFVLHCLSLQSFNGEQEHVSIHFALFFRHRSRNRNY